jgi:hypothetical protein
LGKNKKFFNNNKLQKLSEPLLIHEEQKNKRKVKVILSTGKNCPFHQLELIIKINAHIGIEVKFIIILLI